jgi:hypothetical protein
MCANRYALECLFSPRLTLTMVASMPKMGLDDITPLSLQDCSLRFHVTTRPHCHHHYDYNSPHLACSVVCVGTQGVRRLVDQLSSLEYATAVAVTLLLLVLLTHWTNFKPIQSSNQENKQMQQHSGETLLAASASESTPVMQTEVRSSQMRKKTKHR